LGDDLYDDEDADSNEQERPASMMSPAGHTVSTRLLSSESRGIISLFLFIRRVLWFLTSPLPLC
jgi:hypothetical protein